MNRNVPRLAPLLVLLFSPPIPAGEPKVRHDLPYAEPRTSGRRSMSTPHRGKNHPGRRLDSWRRLALRRQERSTPETPGVHRQGFRLRVDQLPALARRDDQADCRGRGEGDSLDP